jgi:hypothetical protein
VDTGFDGSFLFNLSPNPATITATNIQIGNPLVAATHWSLLSSTPGSLHFDGFGDFEYAMRCDDCQGGGNAVPGPLVFDITGTGLDTTSFEATSTGSTAPAYFGVDLFAPGPPAHTGPVGATGLPHIIRTPEPSSFLLFGTTALAFFAFVWHRKRSSKGLIQK